MKLMQHIGVANLARPRSAIACLALCASAIFLVTGAVLGQAVLLLGALGTTAAALALVLLERKHHAVALELPTKTAPVVEPTSAAPAEDDLGGLISEMLAHGRHALLLRPQLVGNLRPHQLDRTIDEMREAMSLVPAGEVALSELAAASDDDVAEARQRVLNVDSFYLDRFAVTNRQYYQFVSSGGYEQMAIWEPEIWPAVLDFVDRTGCPGPRYWCHGKYDAALENHPVVGVCWYEAAAFARWIGKRLPTDAEWVKAASWPITLPGNHCVQRRYPWGDTMDRTRANLWGSGAGTTVAVNEFAAGTSIGGIYQLIGNVWEWTSGQLDWRSAEAVPADKLAELAILKSLRGGAFNTYFESQATCQFQSGDHPLARKSNIGFRCALGVCDVALPTNDDDEESVESAPELLIEAAV